MSLLEAMAEGLPVICSNIRGNKDLIKENQGGYLVEGSNADKYMQRINEIISDNALREKFGSYNKLVVEEYDISKVSKKMEYIYKEVESLVNEKKDYLSEEY